MASTDVSTAHADVTYPEKLCLYSGMSLHPHPYFGMSSIRQLTDAISTEISSIRVQFSIQTP